MFHHQHFSPDKRYGGLSGASLSAARPTWYEGQARISRDSWIRITKIPARTPAGGLSERRKTPQDARIDPQAEQSRIEKQDHPEQSLHKPDNRERTVYHRIFTALIWRGRPYEFKR